MWRMNGRNMSRCGQNLTTLISWTTWFTLWATAPWTRGDRSKVWTPTTTLCMDGCTTSISWTTWSTHWATTPWTRGDRSKVWTHTTTLCMDGFTMCLILSSTCLHRREGTWCRKPCRHLPRGSRPSWNVVPVGLYETRCCIHPVDKYGDNTIYCKFRLN